MTPSERNALLFLSFLLLLGVSVRLVRSRAAEVLPSRAERAALAAQVEAVDSVRSTTKSSTSRRRSNSGSRTASNRSRQNGSAQRSQDEEPKAPAPSRRATRPVDLDVASVEEIEALPWIGPVLAERIVQNRDSLGPFGSMDQLQRVYGVGPGMARRLEGRVTFSLTPRHFRVEDRSQRTSTRASARPPARPRAP